MNKFIVSGNLVRQPELRASANGTNYCLISVASHRPGRKAEGKPDTDFFNISIFGKSAENIAKLPKGAYVLVEGYLQNSSYEKNGQKVFTNNILATNVDWSMNRQGDSSQPNQQANQQHQAHENVPDGADLAYANMPF